MSIPFVGASPVPSIMADTEFPGELMDWMDELESWLQHKLRLSSSRQGDD